MADKRTKMAGTEHMLADTIKTTIKTTYFCNIFLEGIPTQLEEVV
ncbi:hypothetical protein V7114_21725 [Neobacillus niacini]